ncbi:ABC transporter ATP-binding protein [Schlesneria paludicola]|uniref:ABC transporter ATP-binding protein n=1 Tax=Schlesneria paludicola TaxID=360056 RepID=UPI00029B27EB|nr:ABC transporter ATP-binding protein [Schlesneria paludicola]
MSEPNLSDSAAVIELTGVSRHFGQTIALNRVNLTVPRGGVFGLIGGNGAGKTTLIKHILGMLTPREGTVRVFGLDPVQHPVETLGRIGYLSEDRDLPDWMRVGELIRYTQAFYPTWDETYAEELRQAFELDVNSRVKSLSRGQRARAGLLISLAYRPDLLVLDEPSSGLDPVVRRDILSAIIRTIADEGRTVLFSSHLLDEVERVADHVAMIHQGQIILSATMDDMKEQHRRLTLRFAHPVETAPILAGALTSSGRGHEWTYICSGERSDLMVAASSLGASVIEDATMSLDEIFVARVLNRRNATTSEMQTSQRH